jgi:acetolactate synthase I/II/III large subunit
VFPDKLVGLILGVAPLASTASSTTGLCVSVFPSSGSWGNDGVWGNIKTFHKMMYPERVVAADLGRRLYHDVVSAPVATESSVTDPEELAPALKRARASGVSLVNVHIADLNDPAMTQLGFMPRMSSNYSQESELATTV